MSKKNISGRKAEITLLQQALSSANSEFIAVYGRRRVGKTYLVREFFDNALCFEITGIHRASLNDQLANFVQTSDGPWRYMPVKESPFGGAQIDLLIDRRDATINICEIKFYQGEFTLDAAYTNELRRKMNVFRQVTGTRKNIFLTMITTYGVTDNAYRKDLVSNVLTLDALF